jgi:dTDP-glucose 4,6-dehydratase
VYGRQPSDLGHVDESYAGAPDATDYRSAYGEGKRTAETLCAAVSREHPGLEPLIARCFAFVGPHLPLDAHFAIGNFIGDVLAGRTIQVRGDGSPVRSYLYAADLAVWLWTILFRGERMRPYNVGSEEAVSILDAANVVSAAITPPSTVSVAGQADPARRPERYVPSTGRARNELGLEAAVSLPEAVVRTIDWHRARARP